jgi:hypothetical protein
MMVNIDGLPISKSSTSQFWPIIGLTTNDSRSRPFPIGLFHGLSKPKNVNDILKDFVIDYQKCPENGVQIHDLRISISLACFVCDAAASCMLGLLAERLTMRMLDVGNVL